MQVLKTKLSRPSMLNGRAMQRPQLLSQIVDYCQSSLVFYSRRGGLWKNHADASTFRVSFSKGKESLLVNFG